jgi:hypothetical protein
MGEPDHQDSRQLANRLAEQIRRLGLTLPALVLLEVARPFGFIASQGLLLCQPLLGYFVEEPRIAGYVDLLSDRDNIDHLLARLDSRSHGGEERD